MSMMLPPGSAPPNLPTMPGGGDMPAPPMDSLAGQSLPTGGGLEGLMAALGGGGGGAPGEIPLPPGDNTLGGTAPEEDQEMDAVSHIQQAMKHLLMAIAKDDDDERGLGITKGMGALQGILAGEQKKNSQLTALGG